MTKEELLKQIQDAIQREDPLNEDMKLESIEEWDSLAIISIITLYGSLGIKVSGNQLRECKVVKDLIKLAEEK